MPKYAVVSGKDSYIADSWDQAKQSTHGVPNSYCKKFDSHEGAQSYLNSKVSSDSSNSGGSSSYSGGSSYSRNYSGSSSYGGSYSGVSGYSGNYSGSSSYGGSYGNSSSGSSGGKLKDGSDGFVDVYTDGSCPDNGYDGAKAGIGVYFGPNHSRNVSEPLKGRATNNEAEIQAAWRGIEEAKNAGYSKVRVHTDSKLVADGMNKWIGKWKTNDFRTAGGDPVVNKDSWIKLDNSRNTMEKVEFHHVKGHDTCAGNNEADKLARAGAEKYVSK